jgi:hypothetical protein
MQIYDFNLKKIEKSEKKAKNLPFENDFVMSKFTF